MAKKKPIIRYDCRFLDIVCNNENVIEYRCGAFPIEGSFLISCSKDCPFFEKPLRED